jgi:hypothetical protein
MFKVPTMLYHDKQTSEPLGWLYLLPSDACNVIVKYSPKWAISCVIPKSKKKITACHRNYHEFDDLAVTTRELEIETPNLIWSHSLKKPWESYSKINPYFSLFAINLNQSNGLFAVPYRLANVYSSATVCFGDSTQDITNLRQANNYFWASPFNEDNCPYKEIHRKNCEDRSHEWYDHYDSEDCDCGDCGYCDGGEGGECRCECCINICGCNCPCSLTEEFFSWISNYDKQLGQYIKKNSFFCGKKYFACPKPTEAIFLSNNKKLFEKVPKTNWRRDYKNTNVVIGVASKNYNNWEIDLGSFQFKMNQDTVRII